MAPNCFLQLTVTLRFAALLLMLPEYSFSRSYGHGKKKNISVAWLNCIYEIKAMVQLNVLSNAVLRCEINSLMYVVRPE